jgi:SAM-dependent methyltransferase
VIYFDRDNTFYALESGRLEDYRVRFESASDFSSMVANLAADRDKVITDGQSYFVVPRALLIPQEYPQPAGLDLQMLQDHFFSEEAVDAAMDVAPEALNSEDRGSLIYGTTGAKSIYQALVHVAAGSRDRFLDIGCGCGLPVMVASHFVSHATGVDIVSSMIEFGTKAAAKLGRTNTNFVTANIRDMDIQDIDIVYVAATTLTDELRKVIAEKLEQLRPGAIVISLTYPLACDHLVLIDSFKSPFAWWSNSAASEHKFLIHLRQAA